MPVIRKSKPSEPPRHAELTALLVTELQNAAATGPETAPLIVEDENRRGTLHVQVVWDEFDEIAPEQRGKIIMDAYEEARPDELSRITIAMGLTHKEATRLGIGISATS
jgi:hypothetical protein